MDQKNVTQAKETIVKSLKKSLETIDNEIKLLTADRAFVVEALSLMGDNTTTHLLPYAVLDTTVNDNNNNDIIAPDNSESHHPPADAIKNYDKNSPLRKKIAMIFSSEKKPLTTRQIFNVMIKYEKNIGGQNEENSIAAISSSVISGVKKGQFKIVPDPTGEVKKRRYYLR